MKIVAIVSGGMDSITMLYRLIAEGHDIKVLSYDYNQRHKKELKAAEEICSLLRISHQTVDITSISELISNSALTGNIEVPQGHYKAENMKVTVVPSRNTIMLSIANGLAVNLDYDAIAIAVHAGDHFIYPDCRPEFIYKTREQFKVNNFKQIQVLAPYLFMNKISILAEGTSLGVDYSKTWTCYEGRDLACGKCGACQERLEAFTKNGIKDPLLYENDKKPKEEKIRQKKLQKK